MNDMTEILKIVDTYGIRTLTPEELSALTEHELNILNASDKLLHTKKLLPTELAQQELANIPPSQAK